MSAPTQLGAHLECQQLLATEHLCRRQLLLWSQLRQRHLLRLVLASCICLISA
jgi:hypothetical protein